MFWANEDTETKFTLVLVSFLFFKKYIFLHVYLLVYDKNYALHISRDTRVALDNILRTPFLVPTIVKVLPPSQPETGSLPSAFSRILGKQALCRVLRKKYSAK